jgi:hypothetical protein
VTDATRDAYDELYVYTMERPSFVLQHVVDAFGAQTASEETKPIRLVFALVGLYLRVEKQYSGKRVQRVHMQLGESRTPLPAIPLPKDRGSMTVVDVLAAPAGPERDAAIDAWCRSVWNSFRESRQTIVEFLQEHGLA